MTSTITYLDKCGTLIKRKPFKRVKKDIKHAAKCGATAIVLETRHETGNLFPTRHDLYLASRIKKAAKAKGLVLTDYLIVSNDNRQFSFAENVFFYNVHKL